MLDIDVLKSIFTSNNISKFILIEEENVINFVICQMNDSLTFEKWNNLENILAYYTKKTISINSYPQAIKYLGNEYLNKGVIIGE